MRTAIGATLVLAAGAVICASQTPVPSSSSIPVGTMFNVALQSTLTSATAKQDQRFNTGTLEEWKVQGKTVVDLGSTVRGFVSSVRPAAQPVAKGAATGIGSLTLSFDEVVIAEKPVRMRASVVNIFDPRKPKDGQERRNAMAGVVGGEGAFGLPLFTDATVGRGGSITAPGGEDVKIPVGMVLRIRLDQALEFPSTK